MRKAEAFSVLEFTTRISASIYFFAVLWTRVFRSENRKPPSNWHELNLGTDNFSSMAQRKKAGRPREWVLEDEIVEIHRLSFELKTRNPGAHWSAIKDMVRTQLEQTGRKKLLSKLNKLWGLMLHVVPLPQRCICGESVYSYAYRKVESDYEHYWEIFARCTNPSCRYLRRYLPGTSYSWSRPKSIIKEVEKLPTFYELDGQKVEGDE